MTEIKADDLKKSHVSLFEIFGITGGHVVPKEEIDDDGKVFHLGKAELFQLEGAFTFFWKYASVNFISVVVVACSHQFSKNLELLIYFLIDYIPYIDQEDKQGKFKRGLIG